MKPLSILFLCILIIPTAEIYLLIQMGQVIGAAWTIFGVVATAVIGAWLIKLQGLLTFQRALGSVRNQEIPAVELIEGVLLLIAAAFLITPGFVTDAVGFMFTVPSVRRRLASALLSYAVVHLQSMHPTQSYEVHEVYDRRIGD